MPTGEPDFHPAIRSADRGCVIVHGAIVFEGNTAAELARNPPSKSYFPGLPA